jgi:hypothetical protein
MPSVWGATALAQDPSRISSGSRISEGPPLFEELGGLLKGLGFGAGQSERTLWGGGVPPGDADPFDRNEPPAYASDEAFRPSPWIPHPSVARVIAPEKDGTSLGSGTLVHVHGEYGLVLTNWHVVASATEPVSVAFPDGFRSTARIARLDSNWDLAALVIRRPNAEPVPLSDRPPQPGDPLTIAGYGKGSYRAARGRCTQYLAPGKDQPFEMVEVSVMARQGDSGGPIFNDQGELAGVLFGAGGGTTTGSYCGRVEQFLATVLPKEPPNEQLVASQSPEAPELTIGWPEPPSGAGRWTSVARRPDSTAVETASPAESENRWQAAGHEQADDERRAPVPPEVDLGSPAVAGQARPVEAERAAERTFYGVAPPVDPLPGESRLISHPVSARETVEGANSSLAAAIDEGVEFADPPAPEAWNGVGVGSVEETAKEEARISLADFGDTPIRPIAAFLGLVLSACVAVQAGKWAFRRRAAEAAATRYAASICDVGSGGFDLS